MVKLLSVLWPDGERRIQDRGATKDGPDIVFADARLHGEVKHRKTTAIQMAIRDARANCQPGFFWFAVDWITNMKSLPVIAFDLHQFIEFQIHERTRHERIGYDRGIADEQLRSRAPLPELPPGWVLRQGPDKFWYGEAPGIRTENRLDRSVAAALCWDRFLSAANPDLTPEWRMYFTRARDYIAIPRKVVPS